MTAFYARVVDSLVVEICDAAALSTHHPDLATTFIACPAEVAQNWRYAAPNNWSAPGTEPAAPPRAAPKKSPKK